MAVPSLTIAQPHPLTCSAGPEDLPFTRTLPLREPLLLQPCGGVVCFVLLFIMLEFISVFSILVNFSFWDFCGSRVEKVGCELIQFLTLIRSFKYNA